MHLDISPDGSKIVFVSQRAPDYDFDLWVMNEDGSRAVQITARIPADDNLGDTPFAYSAYSAYWPRWSNDGQWIVFVKNSTATGDWLLKKVRADGSDQETLLNKGGLNLGSATWSPGASRSAYAVEQ